MCLVPREKGLPHSCVARHPISGELVIKPTGSEIDPALEYSTAYKEPLFELVDQGFLGMSACPEQYALEPEGIIAGREFWKNGKQSASVEG